LQSTCQPRAWPKEPEIRALSPFIARLAETKVIEADRSRIGRKYPTKIPAQILCVAQDLSESQILGAGSALKRWVVENLNAYNPNAFRTAAAWHEA
jgi:hypothetical protein